MVVVRANQQPSRITLVPDFAPTNSTLQHGPPLLQVSNLCLETLSLHYFEGGHLELLESSVRCFCPAVSIDKKLYSTGCWLIQTTV